MGAYLTQPKTDKDSTDECSEYLQVGASSMQGWRNSQEVELEMRIESIIRVSINISIVFL